MTEGIYKDQETELKRALDKREARVRDLEGENRALAQEVRSLKEKGLRFDEMKDRLKDADAASRTMSQQASTQGDTIAMLQKERDSTGRITD